MYWQLFVKSGDPEAYMQYRRQDEAAVRGPRRTTPNENF